jgi:hypothetical protein
MASMDQPQPKLTTLGKIFFGRMIVSIVVVSLVGVWILMWPPDNFVIPLAVVMACIASRFVVHFFAKRRPLVKSDAPKGTKPNESKGRERND